MKINNSKLFFLIFRNIFLNSLIFNHIRLYNKYSKLITFKSIREYEEFQFKEYIEKLEYNFPKIVNINSNTIKVLKLGDNFFKHVNSISSIPVGFIPNSVTNLEFSNSFNKMLKLNANHLIPSSVIKLNIGSGFNRVIEKDDAPKSIKSIKFGISFNSTFNFLDCINLKKIRFDKSSFYNQDILLDHLPMGLETIVFGSLFNREILPRVLPSSLTFLDFTNSSFNKPITAFRTLVNLVELKFSNYFNSQIEPGDLPLNGKLESIKFGTVGYDKAFKIGTFPQSLTTLDVKCYKHHFDMVGILPCNLTTLKIGISSSIFNEPFNVGIFPPSITKLFFGYSPHFSFPFEVGVLPSCLKEFSFSHYDFPIEKGVLPDSIESLSLPKNDSFNKIPPLDIFPKNLKYLNIMTKLESPIQQGQLPFGIEQIKFFKDTTIEPHSLPSTVSNVLFIGELNLDFKVCIISDTLKSIYICDDSFNSIFEPYSLPQNLTSLSILSPTFNQPFPENSLPNSLLGLFLPFGYSHPIITNSKILYIIIGENTFNQNYYGIKEKCNLNMFDEDDTLLNLFSEY